MSDALLWDGGQREGRPPAVRVSRTLSPSGGVRLGAWVAPAVFGAQPDGTIPVVDVTGAGIELSLGLRRHGLPFARIRCGDDVVELDGATRVAELGWTRLELTIEPGSALLRAAPDGGDGAVPDGDDNGAVPDRDRAAGHGIARFRVGDNVVGSAPALLPSASQAVDAVVGGEGDGWYGWFVGVLGPVWLSAITDQTPARPAVLPGNLWRVPADAYGPDRDRPRWHFLPPRHWMNEPHGIVHHAGRHHLFYQRSELGPFWGEISWGHAVSDDLVRWTDVGHALTPWDVACAPDGVWSGSAAVDDAGSPVLFFTAGDARDEPNQRTAFARPDQPDDPDLRRWSASGPVTTAHQAAGALAASGTKMLAGEFRDPFVWREDGTWFQLVGAGIEGRGGTALLYRCDDPEPVHWTAVGPLAIGDAVARPDTGVMWELPLLLPVGPGPDGRPRHALFVTPWWPGPTEHSLLHEWYWVGTWDATTATWHPEHDEPRELDHGGWLTGVTGSLHPDGRTLLWSITQDLLGDDEHRRRRWAGSAGVPLQVHYADGDLHVGPVDEITALRAATVCDVRPDAEGSWTWDAGPSYEIRAELHLPPGAGTRIELREGSAAVLLHRTDEHTLDVAVARPHATEPGRALRSAPVRVRDDLVHLRVLVDHSVVEAFVAGRPVTTRAWARDITGAQASVGEAGTLTTDGARLRSLRVDVLDAAPVGEDRRPA